MTEGEALDWRPESVSRLSEMAQRSVFAGNKLLVQRLSLQKKNYL